MDYRERICREAEVTEGTKRCRICDRVRPLIFFARQSRRYYKSYCKPCHRVFQSWRGKIDREENRTLTVEEFRTVMLPVLIETGQAKWLDETIVDDLPLQGTSLAVPVSDPDEVDPYPFPNAKNEVEKKIRHNAIMEALRQTSPLPSD